MQTSIISLRPFLLPFFLFVSAHLVSAQKVERPLYKNPTASVEARTQDLLKRMTLEEKIGQMTQIATPEINIFSHSKDKAEKFQPFLDPAKARKMIREYKVGSFLAAFAVLPAQWYTFSYELQKIALEESRLGIPIIYGNDHVHGANYVTGATYFPQPLNLANTFNIERARQMAKITALETADLGQHWNFAPILDIGRNPWWPRQYETFGESTFMCAQMGKTYIQALQNCPEAAPYKIAACAKHFIGYSDPKSGWDRVPSIIPDQELREFFLPPFQEAVKAGVKTFMINSGELNGVPVHASKALLTDLLRKELGFTGVVVTDWADILQLIGQHRVAHNEREATKMALEAGIDMSMTANSTSFCSVTKELVESGELSEAIIDSSCARILRLKFELGLFENPFPRKDRFDRIGKAEHKQQALELARESIVLLKNKNQILPLPATTKKIVLCGPASKSKRNITGGWTIEWAGAPEAKFPEKMETLFSALKKEFPGLEIVLFDSTLRSASEQQKFDEACRQADMVLCAVGEEPYAEGKGNIMELQLPEAQTHLVERAVQSGKPVVVIMAAGRPRLLDPKLVDKLAGFIFFGLAGEQGGQAMAEILSGKINPSGRLAITYPSHSGHTVPYNVKQHDAYTHLFPFGAGLSYTEFAYSDLKLSDSLIHQNQTLKASVKLKNIGKRAGKTSTLWYLKDEVRSITPPQKELRFVHFNELSPGQEMELSFEIRPREVLAFPNAKGDQLLEPGYFELEVSGMKRRFFLKAPGQSEAGKPDKNKKYLQQDLLD